MQLLAIHYLRILDLITQKNKHDYYRSKNCIKSFCKDLKEHATKIISYGKKRNEENKSYHKQKACDICKKEFSTDNNDKKYYKVKDYYHYTRKYRGAALKVCNLRYKTPK